MIQERVGPAMQNPAHWIATTSPDYSGPRIGLVHGLAAGRHMERHLLRFLREAGYPDTTLYSNHRRPASIADAMHEAADRDRRIVLVGYSQGGFQAVKVAHELARRQVPVALLVTIAAGGAGRLYWPQIGANPRRIPANVRQCLNYFASGDLLGTDPFAPMNLARAESPDTHLENVAYPREPGIDHIGVVRCYPAEKVAPPVRSLFLDRLLRELQRTTNAG